MTTTERQSILDKIKALLSKTVANGCSEHEALMALTKARAMMDAYEVTPEDLKFTKEQKAQHHAGVVGDVHRIQSLLARRIAEFTETKAYINGNGFVVFVGLRSDTDFAHFLLNSLRTFVLAELVEYLASNIFSGPRQRYINGFVSGCTTRINQRLYELVEQSRKKQSSNSTALVVVKQHLIDEAMADMTITKARRGKRKRSADAYWAGHAAGDRATFGRPIEEK